MTEATTETAAPVAANILAIAVPHSATTEGGEDQTTSIDLSAIPQDARLTLLQMQVRDQVRNRVNVAYIRNKTARAPFLAWAQYEAAQAVDPMQTTVAKPEGEKPTGEAPAAADVMALAAKAVADLLNGEIRAAKGEGKGKSRAPKDPLVAAVTPIVTRAVYDANKGTKVPVEGKEPRAFTYPDAVKLVGGDGIKYLNDQIDAKVAAGADRAQLEKSRDERYINPAKVMIGQSPAGKKGSELPSIL